MVPNKKKATKKQGLRVSAIIVLMSGLFSQSACAALYPFDYSTDGGVIPQGGTTLSFAHTISTIPSSTPSISSFQIILNFSSSASLLGNNTGIEGKIVLGTDLSSPFVDFYPVNNAGSEGTWVYSATFSGSSGSPGSGFNGLNPNDTWGLVLWDHSSSGTLNALNGWTLDITAVPEPVNVALGIFAGVFVVGGLCRTQQVRNRLQHCWAGINHWLDAV